jgi:hypothetical protein
MSGIFSVGGAGNVGASGSFYPYSIDQSLRFNDNDSANLSRTFASAGNQQIWTWSGWVKRGNLASGSAGRNTIFSGSGTQIFGFMNPSTNATADNFGCYLTDSEDDRFMTNRLFRDTSWYHLVVTFDSTAATNDDRFRLWVNGVQETSWSRFDTITQNRTTGINAAAVHAIGVQASASSQYFDGYMAEVHFIDGAALDATSFGETINGIWVPKNVSGLTYGTNGFYLSFADSAAIGDDLSGNTNDWTANNLAASDVVPDSPTNNFAVMNPLDSNVTISEGNLKALGISGTYFNAKGSFNFDVGLSDGWYFEFLSINGSANEGSVGIAPSSYLFSNVGSPSLINDTKTYNPDGSINFSTSFAGDTWGNGDIIGVAVKNGKVYYSKNGVFQASADPANETNPAHTGLTGFYAPFMYSATASIGGIANFGQDSTFAGATTAGGNADANGYGDFKYAPPSGFLAMCSANLPEPAIGPNSDTTSDEHFNTVLYTGNGTAIGSGGNAITGVGFQPDWVWIKERSGSASHGLYDVVRGVTEQLESDTTAAETTESEGLTTFGTDGFTVGSLAQVNTNTDTYASWNWKAGGTAVSNTDGSITSQVSANTDAGFSIVSWVGSGANATVGHGLAAKPQLIIAKNRNGTPDAWPVYSETIGAANRLYLNLTSGSSAGSTIWNNTEPTNQVFSVGTASLINQSTKDIIAYCFHSVDGFSKVGSYTGNGSTNGTFVYTGFRPAFVLTKESTSTSGWNLRDNKRSPENVVNEALQADTTGSELTSGYDVDFLSNGFKLRTSLSDSNTSGQTYIYLAFAEAPAKYSNAR